jgi:hypothetical protein
MNNLRSGYFYIKNFTGPASKAGLFFNPKTMKINLTTSAKYWWRIFGNQT